VTAHAGAFRIVDRAGQISEFPLKDVKFSKAAIENAAQGGKRAEAITHIAYSDGKLFVAGLSNEEFASKLGVSLLYFPGSMSEYLTLSCGRSRNLNEAQKWRTEG